MDALFGIPVERIYLSFNADILFMVEYEFKSKYIESLKSKLEVILGKGTFRNFGNLVEWSYGGIRYAISINSNVYLTIR